MEGAKWEKRSWLSHYITALPASVAQATYFSPRHLWTSFRNHDSQATTVIEQDTGGNAMMLECHSAEIQYVAENKHNIKESPETSCTVTLLEKSWADETPTQKLQVNDAIKRAQAANQIK